MLILRRNESECIKLQASNGEECHIKILEIDEDEYGKLYVKLGFIANKEFEVRRYNFKPGGMELDTSKFVNVTKADLEKLKDWHSDHK